MSSAAVLFPTTIQATGREHSDVGSADDKHTTLCLSPVKPVDHVRSCSCKQQCCSTVRGRAQITFTLNGFLTCQQNMYEGAT